VRTKDWRNYWSKRKGYQLMSKKKRNRIRKLKGRRGRRSKGRSWILRLFMDSMNVRTLKLTKK